MDRPFLIYTSFSWTLKVSSLSCNPTEIDPRIEASIYTEQIQRCLAIVVAFPGLVDLGLSQHNQTCTFIVPLQLDLVAFEKVLLRHGGIEIWDIEDLDCGG